MSKTVLTLGLLLLVWGRVGAEECQDKRTISIFEDRPWYRAFPAAPHEPQSTLFFGKSRRMLFTNGPGVQTTMEGSIGIDVPILIADGDKENKSIGAGCLGYGVWLGAVVPLALNFTLPGQPVMATDYIPSLRGKLAYGLSGKRRLAFLLEYGHESDHTTWDAVRENFHDFVWIDVNHEFIRTGVDWESEEQWGMVNLRFSILFAAGQGHDGFYSADNVTIFSSTRNWVPSIGLQYSQNKERGWGYFIAAYAAADPVFNTGKVKGEPEKVRLTRSFLVGLRNFSHKGLSMDPVLNFFVGRNPYGVFRTQNTWWVMRVGVIIHR